MSDRHLASLMVSQDLILDLLRGNVSGKNTSIPDDAIVHSVYYDHEYQSFFIVVEHDAYPIHREGMALMRLDPVVVTVEVDSE